MDKACEAVVAFTLHCMCYAACALVTCFVVCCCAAAAVSRCVTMNVALSAVPLLLLCSAMQCRTVGTGH